MNVPLEQFNMPPEANLAEAPPTFTECVSHDESRPPESGNMAKRLQELLEQIQSHPNPAARTLLQECVQSLLAFYGDGLSRILRHVQDAGPTGEEILERLMHDHAVSGLLLIHGLHPVALETRLRGALEKVRPYMQSHGGNIELLGLENDVARVKLQGTCKSCPSSGVTLELAVRRAVEEACPDLLGFEVVGANGENPA
jgi:Fe-S cluster biogenesis protein NfuA